MSIVIDTFDLLDNVISSIGTDWVSKGTSFATPFVKTFVTLYIVIWGIRMLYGAIDQPIKDFIYRIILLTIWLGIFLNVGLNYNSIFETFWSLPDGLVNVFSGAENIPAQIEEFYLQIEIIVKKIEDHSEASSSLLGFPNMKAIAVSMLFNLVGFIIAIISLFHYALAKIWLAILLGIGPIFLLFYIFEATKQYSSKWFSQVVYFVIYIMLLSIIIGLLFNMSINMANNLSGLSGKELSSWSNLFSFALVTLIGAVAMQSVPTIASSLGGGVQLMGSNVASRAMMVMSRGRGRGLANYGKDLFKLPSKKTS